MRRSSQIFIVLLCTFMVFISTAMSSNSVAAASKKPLIVGVPADRCPMFYVDHRTNEIVGIGADLLREAGDAAGYEVQFKAMQEGNIKAALDNDKYDLVMPLGSAISSEGGLQSVITDALVETPMTLVTVSNPELPAFNKLRVGMLKSQAGIAETLKQTVPGMDITLYEDVSECVSVLKAGKVDALLNNAYVWSYLFQKPSYSNLRVYPTEVISMGVYAGAPDTSNSRKIIEKLNKGIATIPDSEKQAIILDYTTRRLYKYNLLDYMYAYRVILGIFFIVVVVGVIMYFRLRKAYKVAEEASRAKTLFLANMSHEIRTPINSIMGMGELVQRETNDKKIKQYAFNINSSANALLFLVNDILDFSRMEEDKLKIKKESYHLSSMIHDVNMMITERAESKGLFYNPIVNPNIPDGLIGDESRLKQVLINLLTNGVKYTMAGFVELNIDFTKVENDCIDLKIHVKDSGIGMKPEELDKLFSTLEKIEEGNRRSLEGIGLGLSIVKQILDGMDSKLEIKSSYGVGSEFSFVVRQKVANWEKIGAYDKIDEEVATGQGNYSPSFIAPNVKILAVDDNELNLKVVTGLLERTRMTVDTALSGKTALDLLSKTKYDILLIDHRMPKMDGVELLKHIKYDADGINYYSVCIVLTANVVSGVRDMFIKAGFDDYLEKPVNGKRLEDMLKKYIPAEKIITPGSAEANAIEQNIGNGSEETEGSDDNNEEPPVVRSDTKKVLNSLEKEGYIDIEAGVDYAGTEELFVDTLRFFRDSVDKKSDEIEELYFKEEIEDYTTKVHALKSSARIIGARDLSEKARLLEEAGNRGDLDYIKDNNSELLEDYRKYKEVLEQL
ncbi:response regulator [Butyrivibrio sp. INlla16]|uniref:response regulator n=1 Tax=Butyrivibrio sp. INlla16 TaxID=1520807 RepID=UPI00147F32A8|nr:response regulator [Butyrivibrio sp. INlla16]